LTRRGVIKTGALLPVLVWLADVSSAAAHSGFTNRANGDHVTLRL